MLLYHDWLLFLATNFHPREEKTFAYCWYRITSPLTLLAVYSISLWFSENGILLLHFFRTLAIIFYIQMFPIRSLHYINSDSILVLGLFPVTYIFFEVKYVSTL